MTELKKRLQAARNPEAITHDNDHPVNEIRRAVVKPSLNTLSFLHLSAAVTSILLAAWCYTSSSPKIEVPTSQFPGENWTLDDDFYRSSKSNDILCNFPIIHAKMFEKKRQRGFENLLDQPFIIRGMMTSWPANERWFKSNFSLSYDSKRAKPSSESVIVYGGSRTGFSTDLKEILRSMSNDKNTAHSGSLDTVTAADIISESSDSFTFDDSILQSVPEIGRDFRIPGELWFCFKLYHVIIQMTNLSHEKES